MDSPAERRADGARGCEETCGARTPATLLVWTIKGQEGAPAAPAPGLVRARPPRQFRPLTLTWQPHVLVSARTLPPHLSRGARVTFRFSRTSFRLTRLRPRVLVLLATATTTAALLPLVTPSDAAVPGRPASPVIDPNASPMSPHHGVAPADAMRPTAPVLAESGWSVTTSGTSLTIDMHRTDIVSALVYQPRRTGGGSRVTEYAIRLSTDGRRWTKPVATGTLADDTTAKTLNFAAQGTRYVRLSATTPAAGRVGWAAGTERTSPSSRPRPPPPEPMSNSWVTPASRRRPPPSCRSTAGRPPRPMRRRPRGTTAPPTSWTVIPAPCGTADGHRRPYGSRTPSSSTCTARPPSPHSPISRARPA